VGFGGGVSKIHDEIAAALPSGWWISVLGIEQQDPLAP